MSDPLSDFIDGQDRLSALLRALPAYPPPASQQSSFAQLAREAQRAAPATTFTPSPAIEAHVHALAAGLEADQAAQRSQVLRALRQGKAPHAILNGALHPSTVNWLRSQAEASHPAPGLRARFSGRSLLRLTLPDLGRAAIAAVVAALFTQWLLDQRPSPTEIALLEAFRNEDTILAPLAQVAPQQNPSVTRPPPRQRKAGAPAAVNPMPTPEPDMNAATEAQATAPAPANGIAPPEAASPVPAQASPTVPPAAPPAHARTAPAPIPDVETAIAPTGLPEPKVSVAGTPDTRERVRFNIDDSPVVFALRLPWRPPGLVWQVETPPQPPAGLKAWLDALQRAIPADSRPAAFVIQRTLTEGEEIRLIIPAAQ